MKLKIFVDAHVFDTSYQGTTTYLKGLYSALVEDPDFEITLAANDLAKLKKHFPDPRFQFMQLPSGSKLKRLAWDIPRLLKKNKFDFAHFQYITPLLASCKYINTIHDLLFLDFPEYFPWSYRLTKYLSFRISAGRSHIICTVSKYSQDALMRHFHIPKHKIVLTPNAVEIPAVLNGDIRSKYRLNKYILFVSRFEPRKNHYLLLKTFFELHLQEQGYTLVLIGRIKDVETKKFNDLYQSLSPGQQAAVLHLENVEDNELQLFYSSADLFVYPSYAEGFGIPPLEAGMLKCKVLCSNLTAMSDFEFFGKYLFDPKNEDELKQKLSEVLHDTEYPFDHIQNAIRSNYNWKSIAQDFASKLKQHLS